MSVDSGTQPLFMSAAAYRAELQRRQLWLLDCEPIKENGFKKTKVHVRTSVPFRTILHPFMKHVRTLAFHNDRKVSWLLYTWMSNTKSTRSYLQFGAKIHTQHTIHSKYK